MKLPIHHQCWLFLCLLTAIGMGSARGAERTDTYVFTSKSWAATLDGVEANWISGKDGYQLTSGRGVQVTTGESGANTTSPNAFVRVSKIVVTYCTNTSDGAGSISLQVGSNASVSQNVTKTGGATLRTLEYTFSPVQSGAVTLTVTCSTNSIYVNSISITHEPYLTPTVTFAEGSKTLTIGKTYTNRLTTVPSELEVSYSSSATGVATVDDTTGEVTAVSAGSSTIMASWDMQTIGGETYAAGTKSYMLTVTKVKAVLRFPFGDFYTKTGQSFTAPDLYTYPNDATVTFASSNTAVATVDASTGAVTLGSTPGTTTITASYDGNSLYSNATASYTLTLGDEGTTLAVPVPFIDITGITSLLSQADGTAVRLYLPVKSGDEANARVLQASGTELYVRDDSRALLIQADASDRFVPTPQYNQHVSGWVEGVKRTNTDGLPYLAISGTTDYLVFSAPVTEAVTQPVCIASTAELASHQADWVVIEAQRIGSSPIVVDNRFSLDSSSNYPGNPYSGALVDLSGIVLPGNTLAPVYNNDIYPLIYVIDENAEFTSPSADIPGATVRLVRRLSPDIWNTFAVPFAFEFDGVVREYDYQEGTTMMFRDVSETVPGVPYLIKPDEVIENPVFYDITLSSTAARVVSDGDYSYVATYTPVELATDQTEYYLTASGALKYPASAAQARMKGMRAFFRLPVDSEGVKINFEDDITGIADVQPAIQPQPLSIYSVSGQYMGNDLQWLPQGLYIVNGKKVYVK